MKLTILGSGTSVPHPRRAAPAHWLETSHGTIALDFGADTPHRMAQENLDWPNLDAIWISHFHLDHIGGLTPFLFGLKWAPQTLTRSKPLRIFGPKGLSQIINTVNESNNYRLFEQRFAIEIVEVLPGGGFEILPAIEATTLSTPHTQESLALRLKDEDSQLFVYTSDTGFSEDSAPLYRRLCVAAAGMFFQEKQTCAETSQTNQRGSRWLKRYWFHCFCSTRVPTRSYSNRERPRECASPTQCRARSKSSLTTFAGAAVTIFRP
jgi:ribonuclease BN (tRNA processing enzyme)